MSPGGGLRNRSPVERRQGKSRIVVVAHRPADHTAREQVYDGRKVHPPHQFPDGPHVAKAWGPLLRPGGARIVGSSEHAAEREGPSGDGFASALRESWDSWSRPPNGRVPWGPASCPSPTALRAGMPMIQCADPRRAITPRLGTPRGRDLPAPAPGP